MNITDVVSFIKTASDEDKSIMRACLKNRAEHPTVNDLCWDDIDQLCQVLPRTDAEHKHFRYDMTAMTYARHIAELTNAVLHNFNVHHNDRGYKAWMHCYSVSPNKQAAYKQVFHTLTETVINLIKSNGTEYNKK